MCGVVIEEVIEEVVEEIDFGMGTVNCTNDFDCEVGESCGKMVYNGNYVIE